MRIKSLVLLQITNIILIALEKCKKECNIFKIILVQGLNRQREALSLFALSITTQLLFFDNCYFYWNTQWVPLWKREYPHLLPISHTCSWLTCDS